MIGYKFFQWVGSILLAMATVPALAQGSVADLKQLFQDRAYRQTVQSTGNRPLAWRVDHGVTPFSTKYLVVGDLTSIPANHP
jgi:hypothetical protein